MQSDLKGICFGSLYGKFFLLKFVSPFQSHQCSILKMYAINKFLRKNLNLYFLYSGILRYSFLHLGFFPVLFFSLFTNRACKKIFLIVNLLLWGDNCFEGGDLCIQRCPQLKKALIEDFVKELKTKVEKATFYIVIKLPTSWCIC